MQAIVLVNSSTGMVTPLVRKSVVADNFIVPVGASSFTGNVLSNDVGISNTGQAGTCSGSFSSSPQTFPTAGGRTVVLNPNGSFTSAKNAQGSTSAPTTVTLSFHSGSGLQVTVQDAQTPSTKVADYKWVIEQDLTFQVNPACQQNGPGGSKPANCPAGPVPTLGTNLHTSYMPVIAVGCTGPQSCERGQTVYDPTTGQHVTAACDGYGNCTTGQTSLPATLPSEVYLPPTDQFGRPAYYYISVLPGDAANAFNTGNASDPSVSGNCAAKQTPTGQSVPSCGHTMCGAPIAPGQTSVTVNVEPNPLSTATITAFVFEDDFPLNGEPDTGGGVDTYPTQEAGHGASRLASCETFPSRRLSSRRTLPRIDPPFSRYELAVRDSASSEIWVFSY